MTFVIKKDEKKYVYKYTNVYRERIKEKIYYAKKE